MAIGTLPEGFELDTPQGADGLPEGFELDQAPQPPTQPTEEQPQEAGFFDKILQSTQALGSGNLAGDVAGGLVSATENVGLGIYQAGADLGAEFSGAKSILAKIRPDLAKEIQSFTPEDISEALGRRVTEKKALEKDKGLVFKGSQLAGEVAPFLAGGGSLKAAVGAGAAMAATTPQEKGGLEERAKDTIIGGGLGLFGGVVVKAVSPLVSGAKKQVQKLFAAKKPEDIIARRLKPEVTAKLLEKLKNTSPDSPALMIDMAGDEIKGLTRAVGKLSGGRDIVSKALKDRSFEAVERVEKQLSKNVSSIDTYFGNLDDIAKARSAMAAPLYKKAFEKGTTLNTGRIGAQELTERLGIIPKNITKSQQENRALLRKILPHVKEARKKFSIDNSIADNSLRVLDDAKKILDDKISVAIRGGEKQQASSLLGLKSELLNKLDKLNPDYKKARQVFSDFSSIQSAQEQGSKFSTLKPEQLRRLVDTLAPSEKEAFRIGVRSNLEKTVTSTADEADPAKRIFGNSFKRNQIKAVFGGDTQYKAFEKRMKEEIAAAETKFAVLGGSRTDINIAGEKEFISTVAKVGGGVALGSRFAIINALVSSFNKLFGGISEKNAKALANILVKKEGNIKFLENYLKKEKNETQKRLISEFTESVRPILATRLLTKGAIQKEQEYGNQ